MKTFQGKTVWITGASSGIGEALAYELAKQGANVILSARRIDQLHQVQSKCKPDGGAAMIIPLDLTDENSIRNAVDEAMKSTDQIDLLVNNAGISMRGLVKDTILEVDRRVFEVNFFGTVLLTKLVLPHMIRRQSGHIAVVSSAVGKFGTPLRSAYSASKHALHGFFDSLRAEVWKDNIKVTIICPGFINTQITLNALTETADKLNKMGEAQSKAVSAEYCARKILSGIKREAEEIYVGGAKEKMAILVKRFFPALFSKIIRSAKVT